MRQDSYPVTAEYDAIFIGYYQRNNQSFVNERLRDQVWLRVDVSLFLSA